MTPERSPRLPTSPQEAARAVRPPRRPPRHHHCRPRRRRARGRARPQSVGGYPAALAQNLTEQAHKLQAPVGFADIVAKVKPAVISVRVKVDGGRRPPAPATCKTFRRACANSSAASACPTCPNGPRGMPHGHNVITGQGSGFFISADGYAVTNNHVVEKAESVQVTTDDGKTHNAKVIGTDPRTDLALIKVDGGPFPYVKLSDTAPRIGDWVLAVGNPFGLGGTVTAGIVSARGRDIGASAYDDFIQIDAPVNKGNSGGPTFDTEGNVIGVNTAIFSPSGGSVGIAFAIPADTVKSVISQLKDHGSVTRGWIGVQIQPVTKDIADSLGLKKAEGALVAEPQANSPAAKAGIEAGDVITAVDGKEVKDARDLAKKIGAHGAEDLGQALGPAQGLGKDRHADARRNAEAAGGEQRAAPTKQQREQRRLSPSSASRWRRPRASPAPAAKAWWSPASIPPVSPPTTASPPATSSSRSPANRFQRPPTCAR